MAAFLQQFDFHTLQLFTFMHFLHRRMLQLSFFKVMWVRFPSLPPDEENSASALLFYYHYLLINTWLFLLFLLLLISRINQREKALWKITTILNLKR